MHAGVELPTIRLCATPFAGITFPEMLRCVKPCVFRGDGGFCVLLSSLNQEAGNTPLILRRTFEKSGKSSATEDDSSSDSPLS